MIILFYIFLFFFFLSLLLPFFLVAEMVSKAVIERRTGGKNNGVEFLPVPAIHFFMIMVLSLCCLIMGDFSPVWNVNIFYLLFGLLLIAYLLSFAIGATATLLIERKR